MGSVLTVYVPYDLGTQGRTLLYEGNKKKLAKSVFDQLTKVVPQVEGNIEEIVLSRWGHALAVTRPQYFKYVGELQSLEGNSFSFAHSSAHGLPGAEAAVQGARHAVQRATAAKTSAKPLYSIPASKALQTGLTLFVLFILASVSLLGTAYAKPDSKPTLIYRISAKQDNIFGLNSVGLPAYAIVGGKQLKGTYLTVVKEVGQGHEAGLMAGDVILSINDRVTETPALTTQIITELSGQHLILRYARKSGDTLEVRQTKVYWVITAAGGSDTNSSGYDTTESYGSVRAKPRQESTAELESYMLQLVNNERAMNGGLSKLRHSDMLQAMAKAYADDMAKRGFFSHKNPEGQGTVERATAAGINVHIAENLSYIRGHDDPRDMVKNCQLSMMNEPADNPANHRGNLLDPGHKCVGIGVSFLPTGGVVTVQEFSHDDLP